MTKKSQPEWGLSHWVDAFLNRTLMGPGWHTAVETGVFMMGSTPEQRMNSDNLRRARGIKPHHLDFYAYQKSTGIYAQWELKVEGRPTTMGQDQTIAALQRNSIPTGVFETVPAVCAFLRAAGFDLHANADNIATELHERYLAMRRAAPKKKGAPRPPKRRGGLTVAQGHAMGLWK